VAGRLAAVTVRISAESVGDAYERAACTELTAIATTWEDGFDVSDLPIPSWCSCGSSA
jgi:hypothetical protein